MSDDKINNGVAVSPELAERRDDMAVSGGSADLPGGMELAGGPGEDGPPPYQRVFGQPHVVKDEATQAEAATAETAAEAEAEEPPKRRRSRKPATAAEEIATAPPAEETAAASDEPVTE